MQRRTLLAFGSFVSLGVLFYFKYFTPLIQYFGNVFELQIQFDVQELPLGISFFTFVQIIHLWNCYCTANLRPRIRFLEYLQVLTFFPHLVAGPFVTPNELVPQLRDQKSFRFDVNQFALGLFLVSIGLFKKLVIADSLQDNVIVAFEGRAEDGLRTWIGTISYTFQLYFDFSGYVDIARGISLMFGLTLMHNFDSPLKATDIRAFWSRWHMTLTKIANQYVYTPIALSLTRRRNKQQSNVLMTFGTQTAVPILSTFLLLGLWHGAGVTFVVFGMWHALGVIIYSVWTKTGLHLPRLASNTCTFLYVVIGFVFFRSRDLHEAFRILNIMFDWNTQILNASEFVIFNLKGDAEELIRLGSLGIAAAIAFGFPSSRQLEMTFKPNTRYLIWSAASLCGAMIYMSRQIPILYWQF